MNRALASRIAAVVAVVALPLAMGSVWLSAYIADTDRYVATVTPLAQDPEVKAAAVAILERETLEVLNSRENLGSTLRTLDLSCIGVDSGLIAGFADLASAFLNGTALGNSIREQIEPRITAAVRQAITEAVESETFEKAWVSANRQAHQQVLAALENRPAPPSTSDQVLLPLTEVSALVSRVVPCPNLITQETVEEIRSTLTLVNADDLRGGHAAYQVLQALRWVFLGLFVVGLVTSIGVSRSRLRTGWLLAGGFVLGMGALKLLLVGTKSAITSPDIDGAILDAVWSALTHSLNIAMLLVAVIAGLAAVGLWFVDSVRGQEPVSSQSRTEEP